MSQSILEQLNVDRMEFTDAVNAHTKICSSHLVGSGAGIFSSAIISTKIFHIRVTGHWVLGVPDESTVVSRASSEGTGSKPGVPDEEKLILEWEADVVSEHFDRDDNVGDDNEETKPDPKEIYK
ncbi:hypothetical protein Tco_0086308 [Tanacetum coccineum]